MIQTILDFCSTVKNDRHLYSIMAKLNEEVGELSTEIAIHNKDSYKKPGSDGIIGEGVDCILAIVDLIYKFCPDVTEEKLMEVAIPKLKKWAEKCKHKQ